MDESLFKKVPVKVQKKSGFDLSFQNLLTTTIGTITPVLCEELMPNESVHLKAAIQAQLPPLASDTFMRCDLKYEAFFVPHRLVMKGFEEWLVPGSEYGAGAQTSGSSVEPHVPQITLTPSDMAPGSLADYLGIKSNIPRVPSGTTSGISSSAFIGVNAMPFLAYHRIYDDWYRNTLIQKPIYRGPGVTAGANTYKYSAMNSKIVIPDSSAGYILNSYSTATTATANTKAYYDGVLCTDLRQRNFGYDRFTTATPDPQNGQESGLELEATSASATGFTISQLRAANAIQQWLERNNLAGNRLVDYVRANYGAHLSDGIAQRSLLLGSGQFAVYSKGIYENSNAVGTQDSALINKNENPFAGSVAAQYGSAFASGAETIIDNFTAAEPGYLFVMCTLVPKVNYSTGIDRKFMRYYGNSRTDLANPLLQGTGNEPIWQTELSVDNAFKEQGLYGDHQIFGYQERYADWKSKQNEIHGLIREKSDIPHIAATTSNTHTNYADAYIGSLSSFASQSSFGYKNTPTINSNFLQIPRDYLNNVTAVKDDLTHYGCWIDSFFDFKVSMPLARYSLPTLQDPAYEHGEEIMIDRGGKRL